MRFLALASHLAAALALFESAQATPLPETRDLENRAAVIKPKVFIIDMFGPEGDVWYGIPEFNLLAQNISVIGLSPLYPDVHCTKNGSICQVVTGESEINAATTITSLVKSPKFDLTTTYFFIAGIAGVNPKVATLGSVAFAKYAVQIALAYEFDAREIPTNFTTGYVPLGATSPTEYPQNIYGTEVFEVNEALRDMAISFASKATLNDSAAAIAYRANYASISAYTAATTGPSVVKGDVATSDVYYSGTLLSESVENTTKLLTNGSGVYCMTAQEDNASLEALLRSSYANLTDFSRIIVMRTASDFDRPYLYESDLDNLFYDDQGGFEPAIKNIYLAGVKVVEGIINGWNTTFEKGVKPKNYIGDILDTLPQKIKPDFGQPADFLTQGTKKRDLHQSRRMRRRRSAASVRAAPIRAAPVRLG